MSVDQIKKVEAEIYELNKKLAQMRSENWGGEVANYEFKDIQGNVNLKSLFGTEKQLMVIHNMGQACRYCTLWADGLNGFLPHLESMMSVVLVSKDDPELQRRYANSRGWRFRMASHGGKGYIQEQGVRAGEGNSPGVSVYEMKDDKIFLRNRAGFGPYDEFCSFWSFIGLAGRGTDNWSAQFNYWKRPEVLDDGGVGLER